MSRESDRLYRDRRLLVVFGVTLNAIMGVTSIAPALPAMARALGVGSNEIALVITAFTLPGAFLAPLVGVLSDRYGRVEVLVPSLLIFGCAGLACFFVKSFELLLVLRFLQGIGATGLGILNITIIGDLFAGRRRTAALGYNASILNAGSMLYPAIGGLLASIGWNYPFLLSAAAFPVAILALLHLRYPKPRGAGGFREYASGALNLMRRKRMLALFTITLLAFVMLYGPYLTCMPLILDERGIGSREIGALMSLAPLTTVLVSSQFGRITRAYEIKRLVGTACIFYLLFVAIAPRVSSVETAIVAALLFGAAHGLNLPSIHSLVVSLAPPEYRGVVTSINGMMLRAGQTIGPVLVALLAGSLGLANAFYSIALLPPLMLLALLAL